jgi:hypothetical protein
VVEAKNVRVKLALSRGIALPKPFFYYQDPVIEFL